MSRHGYGTYSRGLCKCDHCRASARAYRRTQRARRLASGQLSHGTRASYDCGCRCPKCKTARSIAYVRNERDGAA